MLSDEEKKAIIELKHYCNLTQYWKNVEYTKYEFDDYIKIILNLIEKQQKEIEELNKKPIFLIKDLYNRKLKEISLQDVGGLIEQGREEMIDKIKAKIESVDYSNHCKAERIPMKEVLQSLLEKE